MSLMNNFLDVFSATSEVRVNDRFGVSSYIPMLIIIVSYLLIVLKIGPSFMKNREPYQLKAFIIVYNIFQVFSCYYISYKAFNSTIPIFQFWKCIPIVPKTDWDRVFNHLGILTFWLKASELSETVVFVLRKKQRQVSFLHLFHHTTMLFLTYQVIKYYKVNQAFFALVLNCNVHVIMYTYYLLAAILPSKILSKVKLLKKFITMIQMIQFSFILIQVFTSLVTKCNVPKQVLISYMVIVSAFFYMFYDFYKKTYNAKRRQSIEGLKK
ncbi:elongation of very long chain fatty acids protein 4-like [Eupeodes corollae]|uniref:elongation of very long chain fatty acids protein 4-like n=1 Tax=Eupeodes corollae TaxID=290404 RepID=UPI00248FE3D4|nr:elongation of very long chain fatty acids protein 4-like [Eupeodes corollae]